MKKLIGLTFLIVLSACSEIPPQAYVNRSDPERYLDTSTEVVHMGLSTHAALAKLADLTKQDPPTSAAFNCLQNDALCVQGKRMLEERGVDATWADTPLGASGVTLVYQRIVAKECDPRYIDNSINPYTLHHPSFGCSVAGNTVSMVSNKKQFTDPALMDFQDGEKAVQAYEAYLEPPKPEEEERLSINSILSGIRQ